MKKTNDQSGFAMIAIVGIVVAVLIVAAGVFVFTQNKDSADDSKDSKNASETKQTASKSETKAETEINALHAKLEEYYNEYGVYPKELRVADLRGLDESDLTDESDMKYEYNPTGCGPDGCEKYTLRYKYKDPNNSSRYNRGGYMTKQSLN